MNCPKCRAVLPDAASECPHCGIIIAKYLERQKAVRRAIEDGLIRAVDDFENLETPRCLVAAATLREVEAGPLRRRGKSLCILIDACGQTLTAGTEEYQIPEPGGRVDRPDRQGYAVANPCVVSFTDGMNIAVASVSLADIPPRS